MTPRLEGCRFQDAQGECGHPVGIRYEKVEKGTRVAYQDMCNLHLAITAVGEAMKELRST